MSAGEWWGLERMIWDRLGPGTEGSGVGLGPFLAQRHRAGTCPATALWPSHFRNRTADRHPLITTGGRGPLWLIPFPRLTWLGWMDGPRGAACRPGPLLTATPAAPGMAVLRQGQGDGETDTQAGGATEAAPYLLPLR